MKYLLYHFTLSGVKYKTGCRCSCRFIHFESAMSFLSVNIVIVHCGMAKRNTFLHFLKDKLRMKLEIFASKEMQFVLINYLCIYCESLNRFNPLIYNLYCMP